MEPRRHEHRRRDRQNTHADRDRQLPLSGDRVEPGRLALPDQAPRQIKPSNRFGFGKAKRNKKKGTAKLIVELELPGSGEIELDKTKKVKGAKNQISDADEAKLPVRSKGKAKRKLNTKGKAKVKAEVTFTPTGGDPNTQSESVKLVRR